MGTPRRVVVPLVGTLLVALVLGGLGVPERAAAAPVAQTTPKVLLAARPDAVSASLSARAQGARVENVAARTQTSSTFANPDGTWTVEDSGVPVQFKDSDGNWRAIDTGLLPAGESTDRGAVGPALTPADITFAGPRPAGTRPAELAAVSAVADPAAAATEQASVPAEDSGLTAPTGRGAVSESAAGADAATAPMVSLAWAGAVPTPTTSGDTSTYPGILPGIDLKLRALRSGFEDSWVIGDLASGRAQPTLDLPLTLANATLAPVGDGSYAIRGRDGTRVGTVAAPVVFDSRRDRWGEPVAPRQLPMTVAKTTTGVTLTVSGYEDYLSDPATVFPVTIDPATTTVAPMFDTLVQEGTTTDASAGGTLHLGNFSGHPSRSYLTWRTASFGGTQVLGATLNLYQAGAGTCTPKGWQLWAAGPSDTSTRWTNQPPVSGGAPMASASSSKGAAGCEPGTVSINATSWLQGAVASRLGAGAMMLRAADESDQTGWKVFASSENSNPPRLIVTYNRAPNVPAAPSIDFANSYSGNRYVGLTTPQFSTGGTDGDGSMVKFDFEVHTSTTGTGTPVGRCSTGLVASGARATCQSSALPSEAQYWVRARTTDQQGLSSGWTPLNQSPMVVSPTIATPPTVSCPAPYTNGSWATSIPSAPVTCTITATGSGYARPIEIRYRLDGAVAETVLAFPQGSPVSRQVVVPNTAGSHQIVARAVNPVHRGSPYTTVAFGYGAAGLSSPVDRQTSTGTFTVTAAGPPANGATVTGQLQWRLAGSTLPATSGWTTDPAAVSIETGPAGATASAVWDATAAVTSLGSERSPQLLDVQLCLTYSSSPATKQCTWATTPRSVLRVPHAFGNGFPTTAAGPGQAALFTGEFTTSTTDVSVPGYTGDLSLSRSASTFAGATDAVTGVFGPGWTAQLDGSDAGAAGMQVLDDTRSDGTIALQDDDGSVLVYQQPGATKVQDKAGSYVAVDEDTIAENSRLVVAGSGTTTTVTLTEDDGTATVWTPLAAPDPTKNTVWAPVSVAEPGAVGKTTYGRDATGRITRIVAPVPPGVSCPAAGTLNPGCRSLAIDYATTTTATSTTPGDVAGQVRQVWLDIYNPAKAGGEGMDRFTVAIYRYDSSRRLVSVTDPRSNLSTSYGYDTTAGRLASITPPGKAPIRFTYDSRSRLKQVTRDPAASGIAASVDASLVYGIPTSGSGLPDLSPAAVAGWDQAKAPTGGAAVFGPDHPVGSTDPAAIAGTDWQWADLQYVDALGYTVDSASYGAGAWQISSTDYDDQGNTIRTLDADAINELRAQAAAGRAVQPDQYASITRYNAATAAKDANGQPLTAAGTYVTDTWGPSRYAALSDGTSANVRPHSHTTYDEGAPNGGINAVTTKPYWLATTVTSGAAAPETASSDAAVAVPADLDTTSVTRTGYAPIDGAAVTGPSSGWTLGVATSTTQVMPDPAQNVVRRTRYDDEGRTVEVRQPKSSGSDAGTTKTMYFRAGTGSGDTRCDSRPQWAGLVCRVYPGGLPDSGPTTVTSTTKEYSALLMPKLVDETSGGATRSTRTTYLPDGRVTLTRTTVTGLAGNTPLPGTKTTYDPATGEATSVASVNDADQVIASTSTGYDLWGRAVKTTDEAGAVATTRYVAPGYPGAGGVLIATDPKTTSTFGYGTDALGRTDRRGSPTSLEVSGVGTYTAAYDGTGNMTVQTMPGGITQTTEYDLAGEPTGLTYSGQVSSGSSTTNGPWLAFSQLNDVSGRVVRAWTPNGSVFTGATEGDGSGSDAGVGLAYDRSYSYDRAGRLSVVRDRTAGAGGVTADPDDPDSLEVPCTTRRYTFDADDNRTSLMTSDGDATTGACTETGGSTSRGSSYDSADRRTTASGYVYDLFGRVTTIPGADTPRGAGAGAITLGYYSDDSARTITQAGTTSTYDLDVAGRRVKQTDTAAANGTTTRVLTRHYTGGGDNPSWVEDLKGGVTTTTRFTTSIGGDLGAQTTGGQVSLSLADLHGDTVTSVDLPTTGPATAVSGWNDYTEYGTVRAGTPTGPLGYGWLGAKQRATTDTGLQLMGARLYNPTTGLFTSTDPVPGGNTNPYTYPTDPINHFDLDGRINREDGGGDGYGGWGGALSWDLGFGSASRAIASAGRWTGRSTWSATRASGRGMWRATRWTGRSSSKLGYRYIWGRNSFLYGNGRNHFRKGIVNRGWFRTGWSTQADRGTGYHTFGVRLGWNSSRQTNSFKRWFGDKHWIWYRTRQKGNP